MTHDELMNQCYAECRSRIADIVSLNADMLDIKIPATNPLASDDG